MAPQSSLWQKLGLCYKEYQHDQVNSLSICSDITMIKWATGMPRDEICDIVMQTVNVQQSTSIFYLAFCIISCVIQQFGIRPWVNHARMSRLDSVSRIHSWASMSKYPTPFPSQGFSYELWLFLYTMAIPVNHFKQNMYSIFMHIKFHLK